MVRDDETEEMFLVLIRANHYSLLVSEWDDAYQTVTKDRSPVAWFEAIGTIFVPL